MTAVKQSAVSRNLFQKGSRYGEFKDYWNLAHPMTVSFKWFESDQEEEFVFLASPLPSALG